MSPASSFTNPEEGGLVLAGLFSRRARGRNPGCGSERDGVANDLQKSPEGARHGANHGDESGDDKPGKVTVRRWWRFRPTTANYAVTADGQRLLMLQSPREQTAGPTELIVIQNWAEELKRLVPVN